MRKKKVRTFYGNMRFDELHTLAGKVVDCLRDSAIFVDPPVAIEEVESLAQDFQTKWEVAKDGGSKLEKTLRDEAKELLLEAFGRLATYVNHTAKGKMSVLVSSGFELESDQKPLRATDIPGSAKITDGPQRNQLMLSFQVVKKASFYEYQYTESVDANGDPIWGEIFQTRSTRANIIAPTRPGEIYYARVRTRNAAGASDWSDTVSLMAR